MKKEFYKGFLQIIELLSIVKDKDVENIEWGWKRLDNPFSPIFGRVSKYAFKELTIKIRYIEEVKNELP